MPPARRITIVEGRALMTPKRAIESHVIGGTAWNVMTSGARQLSAAPALLAPAPKRPIRDVSASVAIGVLGARLRARLSKNENSRGKSGVSMTKYKVAR